jgi:HTH-type transcriptional repressor of NAD biosynthesis genes
MKVVFFGSESSGKTTLCLEIAKYFSVPSCPEYVREYLMLRNLAENRQGIISVYDDIEPMSIGQAALEASFEKYFSNQDISKKKTTKLLLYDTNIETNWIYSNYYFQKTPEILDMLVAQKQYDLYLLLFPDIAWVDDGLRDSPDNRMAMHNLFKDYLINNHRNFIEINGSYENRFQQAKNAINKLITKIDYKV